MEETLNSLRIELGRLKGVLDSLKVEAKKTPISRNECKHVLFELRTVFLSVKQGFAELLKHFATEETKSYPANMLGFLLTYGKVAQNQEAERLLDNLSSRIESIATYQIDSPQYYDEAKIKNEIYGLTSSLEFFVSTFDSRLLKPAGKGIAGFSKIAEFVSQHKFGLDENWAVAACYLSAMDIGVNKKRKEFELVKAEEKESRIPFDQRFDELIRYIESNHGEFSKVLKQLPKHFWKIRTDVIHYGYSPNQEELELIVNWSMKTIDSLSQIGKIQLKQL